MTNLSLDELRLIAQNRNISDYENKFKEDLIQTHSKTKPKPETKPKQISKQETKQTPKQETKQTPKPEIRVNKK